MEKINCNIIYTLRLSDDCWYVGYTTSFAFKDRMNHHWNHPTKGSLWTRLHKPVRVHSIDTYDRSISESDMAKLEDAKTLQLAKAWGIDKVRGGGYCQLNPNWPEQEVKVKVSPPKSQRRSIKEAHRALREDGNWLA